MGATPEEVADNEAPEWYALVQAAKWLGVAPWELLDKPIHWLHWGLAGRKAEAGAERTLNERAKNKAKRR